MNQKIMLGFNERVQLHFQPKVTEQPDKHVQL